MVVALQRFSCVMNSAFFWWYHRYARDFASDLWTLLDWVANVLPTDQAVAVMNCIPMGTRVSAAQCVSVVPFNWAFRLLIPPPDSLA